MSAYAGPQNNRNGNHGVRAPWVSPGGAPSGFIDLPAVQGVGRAGVEVGGPGVGRGVAGRGPVLVGVEAADAGLGPSLKFHLWRSAPIATNRLALLWAVTNQARKKAEAG